MGSQHAAGDEGDKAGGGNPKAATKHETEALKAKDAALKTKAAEIARLRDENEALRRSGSKRATGKEGGEGTVGRRERLERRVGTRCDRPRQLPRLR